MTQDLKQRIDRALQIINPFPDKVSDLDYRYYTVGYMRELAAIIKELYEKNEALKSRIIELERIIQTATIISWDEKELPDKKDLIMLTACELVKKNLDKALPFHSNEG